MIRASSYLPSFFFNAHSLLAVTVGAPVTNLLGEVYSPGQSRVVIQWADLDGDNVAAVVLAAV